MLLRDVEDGDFGAYVRMRCDPAVMDGLGGPLPREGMEAKVRRDVTLQANGTLLDADRARFLKDNGFLVGPSVGGPRALHDAYRVDKGGKPTFDRVMRGLRHLRERGVQSGGLGRTPTGSR